MTYAISFLAAVAVVLLSRSLRSRFATDRLDRFNERRRGTSRLIGRGELVDGNRRVPVALALSETVFFYENADVEGSLELEWIHEVEYTQELTTGQSVHGTVLRLRCFSQTFEFVLPADVAGRWQTLFPARRQEVENKNAAAVAAAFA